MDSGADELLAGRPLAAEERFMFPTRHAVLLLLFAGVYLVVFSAAVPTWVDEAYSFNMASDSSLPHMFSALRAGADGSFPLYALVLHGWAKIFGFSEMSLRLNSALFVFFLVWQLSQRLGKYFGRTAAALSILFVLADYVFTYYVVQARFYGIVVFLFSLCFWSTWDLLQSQGASLRTRLCHALFCGLLCLSHPLGLVYTGILGLLYFAFTLHLRRFSWGNCAAFLGGPALFLLWLPAFLHQRLVNPVYEVGRPGWLKYWQFAFFDDLVLFLTLLAGLLAWFAARRVLRSPPQAGLEDSQPKSNERFGKSLGTTWLVGYSVAFVVCMNGTVALLDAGHFVPVYALAAIRYVLVCWVAYAAVLAAIFATAASLIQQLSVRGAVRLPGRAIFVLVIVGLLVVMEAHWGEWIRGRASDRAYLAKIARVADDGKLQIVCESHWDAFYLVSRTEAHDVKYLLPDNFEFRELMLQIARFYPHPAPIEQARVAHCTNVYLYLSHSPRDARIVNASNQ
jgi:hypothetical protein